MKYDKFDLRNFVDVKTVDSQKIDIVKRFVLLRKKLNLSREQLSKLSNVSYSSIRRFEEKGEIAFSSLLDLAKVLNALDDFDNLFHDRIIGNLEDQ